MLARSQCCERAAAPEVDLSAGEIAALILSACNTAAAGASGAEALSLVSRASSSTRAHALLASHWEVDSTATVKLVTAVIGEITRDCKVGRAEALRRAMLALVEKGARQEAHPTFWAPFVVVGERAAGGLGIDHHLVLGRL